MAATYDPNLTSKKDVLRLLIGDVHEECYMFSDEELYGLLEQCEQNVYQAAGLAMKAITADPEKMLCLRDLSRGSLSFGDILRSWEESSRHWLGL